MTALFAFCVVAASLSQAALTWTGAGDAVSLFKEANWLDNTGGVPANNTIEKGVVVTATTGGLIEIAAGTGTPGNFNGDFMLASGDDLTVANGKVLAGSSALIGGGVGSVLTVSGSGSTLSVNSASAFDSIVVSNRIMYHVHSNVANNISI